MGQALNYVLFSNKHEDLSNEELQEAIMEGAQKNIQGRLKLVKQAEKTIIDSGLPFAVTEE
jgi:hypothetical protein